MSASPVFFFGQNLTLVMSQDDRIYAQGTSPDEALFRLENDQTAKRSVLWRELDGQHVGTAVYATKGSKGRKTARAQIYLADSKDSIDVEDWLHIEPSKKKVSEKAEVVLGRETYTWSQKTEKRHSPGQLVYIVGHVSICRLRFLIGHLVLA
jgi:hypothetical protein